MFELIVAGSILASLLPYAATGGADFGAGMWNLLATGPRAKEQREAITRALAPIWEANHVWLILIVVVLFTGFPRAFAPIMTALNIPMTLILIGIIFRGSAFIFRRYDSRKDVARFRWSTLFGFASFFTPFFEGTVLGALSSGQIRVVNGIVTTGFFAGWITPFAFSCGAFALGLCAFLAATYLTLDPESEREVQNDFRVRALISGAAIPLLALIVFLTSKNGAPEIFHRLTTWWGLSFAIGAGACAIAALLGLWFRYFALARVAVIGEACLVLVGWSLAHYPRIIVPDVTIFNSAAPIATLRLLVIALVVGSVILFPSLAFLFAVFKGKETCR